MSIDDATFSELKASLKDISTTTHMTLAKVAAMEVQLSNVMKETAEVKLDVHDMAKMVHRLNNENTARRMEFEGLNARVNNFENLRMSFDKLNKSTWLTEAWAKALWVLFGAVVAYITATLRG